MCQTRGLSRRCRQVGELIFLNGITKGQKKHENDERVILEVRLIFLKKSKASKKEDSVFVRLIVVIVL